MVVLLMRMKIAVLRNSLSGKRSEDMVTGGAAGLLLAAGTIYLATLHFAQTQTAFDVMIVALTVWTLGWMIGPAMFGGGDETLRPEQFALLPLDSRRLAAGLLGAAFIGVAPAVSLIAFTSLVVAAARLGPAAVAVGTVAALLQLVFVILLSRVSTALLNQVMRTRTGSGLSAAVSAAVMALFGSGWALAPAIGVALATGFPPRFADIIRAMPTGWSVIAVEAAGRSQWALVFAALAGLAVLSGLLLLVWATFLVRRMTTRPTEAGSSLRLSPVKPTGPLSAVIAKELLAWSRDLRRFHFYIFALLYALFFCGLPVAVGSTDFLRWTGILFAMMSAAMSAGLYSEDGTGLWTTLLTPGAVAADVRGRQLAWLTVVAPVALILTVVPTVVTGHSSQLPLTLALLVAVLGGGAGLIVLMAVLRLVPMTDPQVRSGNMMENATDFAQVIITLVLAVIGAVPTFVAHQQQPWAALPAGLLSGAGLAWGLGRLARQRLDARGPELLQVMRSGPVKRAAPAGRPADGKVTLSLRSIGMLCLTVCWIPLVPQGIVPAIMILTGTITPSWFLALHSEPSLRWPIITGMITIGLALLLTGSLILMREKRAVAEL